ncbi:MAG: PINc/VapC family ATPase [Candidatus Aenigmarchaeota archaeon]|nr:PINc/VapC family ATPase [Candidatus Aenigmarchaeota archaeon]
MKINKLVVDTSIIIDGKISEMLEKDEFEGLEDIIIPLAVLDELQAQASRGREPGFVGLDEIKKIRKICEDKKIDLRFTGERPSLEDIKLAKGGRLDALIRDVAKSENGTLVTADYVQGLVAEAEGVKVEYIAPEVKAEELTFEKYFTPDTMSVHLKEKVVPMAKRGKPGEFKLQKIAKEPLTREELQKMVYEIVETARKSEDSFIEAERDGGVIIQMGIYRIAIARPPFSDGFEITIVRPIIKLSLEDYKMSDKLIKRLEEKAEGILIAGPPGSGKTTFASSLAEFYFNRGKIVKTLESPRDLQVGPEITQYGPLAGDFAKTADLLLLVRPDYSIFDEIRQADHFKMFADMRLAGVGMVGVVHASEAIDAVQRFIGKIELGMIPHVIDTVIFIKDGEIKNVYDLVLTVKVPTGMTEADLTRPVVEVRDFENGKLCYEIYTYGEENVVVPIKEKEAEPAVRQLAKQRVKQIMDKYDPDAEIDFISDDRVKVVVDNDVIARLIGKNGTNITEIEKKLGIHIDVEPRVPSTGAEVSFNISEIGNSIVFQFEPRMKGKRVDIYVDSDYLLSATVGKKNEVKVSKSSGIGKEILKGILGKKRIRVLSV